MKNTDYKIIAAWGRFMGSFSYYIRDQQELCAFEKAPEDAIYRRDAKPGQAAGWRRLTDVTNSDPVWYFYINHPDLLKRAYEIAQERGDACKPFIAMIDQIFIKDKAQQEASDQYYVSNGCERHPSKAT